MFQRLTQMSQFNSWLAYFKLFGLVCVWGGNYHVASYLVKNVDIVTISFLRFLIASIALLVLYCCQNNCAGAYQKIRKNWLLLLYLGGIGIFLYNLLFFASESLISANDVALLFAFTPCIAAILSYIFLRQPVRLVGWLGIAIALIGAIAIINLSNKDCGRFFCANTFGALSMGQLFAFGASFSMAIFTIVSKKLSQRGVDTLTMTTVAAVVGALLLAILYLFYGGTLSALLQQGVKFWSGIIYLSLFATVITYRWYSDILHILGTPITVWLNAVPFVAIIIGFVLSEATVSINELIAGVVIIIGAIIATKGNHNAKVINKKL